MYVNHVPWVHIVTRFVAVALLASATLGAAQSPPDEALIQALQRGGYVIVFRHSITDAQKPDSDRVDLNDCATQRILTGDGRILARAIGSAFDRLNIPVDRVYASPLCRTMWTADLAFGHVTVVPGLREPKPKDDANALKASAVLAPLIAQMPAPGANNVIVTHGFNIESITKFTPDEGEATIFRPETNGTFQLIARVKGAQWEAVSK